MQRWIESTLWNVAKVKHWVSVISYLVSTCVSLSIHVPFAIPNFLMACYPSSLLNVESHNMQFTQLNERCQTLFVGIETTNEHFNFNSIAFYFGWCRLFCLCFSSVAPPCLCATISDLVYSPSIKNGLEKLASQNGKHK